MDMVGILIRKYNLEDPVEETGDRIGIFKDQKLQKLYKQLVEKGKRSLIDALQVGATIEDVDIKDLEDAIERTDNEDIKVVYQNLMKGSRNHMRAFVRILRRFGGDYKPQFISEEEFKKILSTKHEAGFYGVNGSLYPLTSISKIEGTVKKVKKVPGWGRRRIYWWVLEVETENGILEVSVAPSWWYPYLNIKEGDKIFVEGFTPPVWRFRGINGIMACKLVDETTNVSYDFSFRRWCRGIAPNKQK